MDSNTINFNMISSAINSSHTQSHMIDEITSLKNKSPSNDSTNFLEYQRYQKLSSSTSKQSFDSNP